MMMWGTPSPSAKLTDDSGSAFEAPLIGDCRLFRSLARNQPPRLLGLLQQYLPTTDTIGRFVLVGRFRRPHYQCIVHPLPWELPAGRAEALICL